MAANISKTAIELFELHKENLSVEQLESYQNLSDMAEVTADSLAEQLSIYAGVLANDDLSRPGDWALSQILYGLADQARNVSALLRVGLEAEYLAKKKSKIEIELSGKERATLEALAERVGLSAETYAGCLILSALTEKTDP